MKFQFPLITCICITSNRITLLKKAIDCFNNQDYPNKELLISYPKKDKLTAHLIHRINTMSNLKILALERPDEELLGNARNNAILKANGEYVCIWDDDDWYHPNRLSYQLNSMLNSPRRCKAAILNQLTLYDQTTHKAYLSFLYTWEGTLLCTKEIFLAHQYTSKDIGEDSSIVDYLEAEKLLHHISGAAILYIYVYHRGNTWAYSHFKFFMKRSKLLNETITQNIRQLIS